MVCSKESKGEVESFQSQLKGGYVSVGKNTFQNISFENTVTDCISFDIFVCVQQGSLNEAFVANESSLSNDSIGDCMEQGTVLEFYSKLIDTRHNTCDSHAYNVNTILQNLSSSKHSNIHSNVFSSAIYNITKSCISLVKICVSMST